jgi:hypothetical protein
MMKASFTFFSIGLILFTLSILVNNPVFGQTILVDSGAVWKYLDDGTNQDTLWRDPGFNDTTWASGPAQLGYGDGDEATVISYGPNPNNKYITYYFRHSFEVTNPSQYVGLLLNLLRDDGAVVYLNGIEIERSNMPAGTINYLTFASSTVSGGEEDMFFESFEDPSHLVTGTNVLAVEIHQRTVTSSDVSFDLKLVTTTQLPNLTRKAPYLIYTGDNKEMQVLWQLNSTDTCIIDWGTDTLYALGSAQTYEYGNDHQHTYTITNLTPATKYYYRVNVNQEIHTGSFRSAPDTNETAIKFFAYGDTRSNPGNHNQVAAAMVDTYIGDEDFQSLIIAVGDLVNNGDSESDWDNQFFNPAYPGIQEMLANLPYQSCMGNHEGNGVLFTKYFPYPFVAGRYWSFDYGPTHFIVVDQYTSYGPGSQQLNWIENDLASTTKPWKFIYLHAPGWSAGGHSNNTSVQNYIQPLCEQYGVPILFAGHNHYYARAEVNGVQHITTGGGGAPLYPPDPNYPNIITATQAYHFCKIEIEDNLLSFKAIKPDGTVIDSFTTAGFNFPPVIISLPDTNAYVNTLYQYQLIAEDNNGDTLTYSLITAPYWLSIDSTNGLIEGEAGVNSVGDTVVTARVYDGRGGIDSQTYTLHIHPSVGIDSENHPVPRQYVLNQNYPNPFNPVTTIKYQIPELSFVTIKVYDVLGNEIETLVNEEKQTGTYEITWYAESLPSGVYFYRLQAGNFVETKKMVLMK